MILEEEYEGIRIQCRIDCPSVHFSIFSWMHLFLCDSINSNSPVQISLPFLCSRCERVCFHLLPATSSSWGHMGSFQIWYILKYGWKKEKELMVTALLASDDGEGVMVVLHCRCTCMLSWTWVLCHEAVQGGGEGKSYSQRLMLHSSSLGILSATVLSLLCLVGQRDHFHFCAFPSDVFHRLEIYSCLKKKKRTTTNRIKPKQTTKKKQLVIQTSWFQQTSLFVRYFGEYTAKSERLRIEPGIIKSFLPLCKTCPIFQFLCNRGFISVKLLTAASWKFKHCSFCWAALPCCFPFPKLLLILTLWGEMDSGEGWEPPELAEEKWK